jgi:hypothetical protein
VKLLFDYLMEKQPWFIRWTFYLMIGLVTMLGGAFTMGWQAAPYADAYIDDRINEFAGPRIILRDEQFRAVHARLDSQQSHFDSRLNSVDNKLDILIGRGK